MKFDVRSLAIQKHRETGFSETEWLKALESARQSLKFVDIDYPSLEVVALACGSPRKFILMTRLIYQYGKANPNGEPISDLLFSTVNESPYSLSQWIDAIEVFHDWLEESGRKIDFLQMLKYLDCCVASPDAQEGGQSFSELLQDMLFVCGYNE